MNTSEIASDLRPMHKKTRKAIFLDGMNQELHRSQLIVPHACGAPQAQESSAPFAIQVEPE